MARRQERARRTREQLLSAARAIFAQKGYSHATVADIVAEAGRGHGTFYLYFTDKRDVFAALLHEEIDSLASQSKAIWRPENPTRSVWATVYRFLEEFGENKDLWLLLDQLATGDERFAELRNEWRETFVRRIRRGIDISAGEAVEGLDSRLLAEVLAAMVDEIARVLHIEGRPYDNGEVALHITSLWARTLRYSPDDFGNLLAEVRATAPQRRARQARPARVSAPNDVGQRVAERSHRVRAGTRPAADR